MTTFDPALVERVARALWRERAKRDFPGDSLHQIKEAEDKYYQWFKTDSLAALTEAFRPQPIETAPRTGAMVLGFSELGRMDVWWDGSAHEWVGPYGKVAPAVTRWLPLPPPVDE